MIIKHCAKVSQYYRQNDFAKTIKRIFTVLIGRQQAPLQKGSPQIKNLLSAIDYTDHNVNKKSADYRPLVTIIVPNYNHANFLHERLDSIYAQTYDNFQVILMDDCSTDDSVNILEQYKNRYPAKTAIYKNDVNGGTPFRQWKKGIGLAEGELVWIAESDDTCDKSFLEALVPFFRNPGVRLAYANTLLMLEGHPHITMRQYLHEVVVDFSGTFVCSAHQFVRHFLSWLNAIPNASAVVFRKDKELALIADNEWQSLRLCGDWLFYLAQIRGGLLAFTDKTQCYYRIHQQGSTNKIQKMALLYEEHWIIANFLAKNYWLLPGWFDKFKYKVYVSCVQNVENFDAKNFNRLLDKQKIFELSLYRKKNLAFLITGNEAWEYESKTMYILVKLLKRKGHTVTIICGNTPHLPILQQLSAQVAIVDYSGLWPSRELLGTLGCERIISLSFVEKICVNAKRNVPISWQLLTKEDIEPLISGAMPADTWYETFF